MIAICLAHAEAAENLQGTIMLLSQHILRFKDIVNISPSLAPTTSITPASSTSALPSQASRTSSTHSSPPHMPSPPSHGSSQAPATRTPTSSPSIPLSAVIASSSNGSNQAREVIRSSRCPNSSQSQGSSYVVSDSVTELRGRSTTCPEASFIRLSSHALLDLGRVDRADASRMRPLHKACALGQKSRVAALLQRGANINEVCAWLRIVRCVWYMTCMLEENLHACIFRTSINDSLTYQLEYAIY